MRTIWPAFSHSPEIPIGSSPPRSALAQTPAEELLEAIGRQRGALVRGGRVDPQKAAELVIGDFRTALLGRITLETPEQYLAWLREARAHEALAQQERAASPSRGRPRT